MKNEELEIKSAIEKLGVEISEETQGHLFKVLENVLNTGTLPMKALGFTDEKAEAIYGQAYRLYNTGKYHDATQLFRLLIVLDSTEMKYLLGYAACFHMMKDYQNAIKVYTVCSVLDGNNPVPQFHASDCFIQMRDTPSAIIALELAIQRAGNKPEYQVLKDRALLTISSLKKELEAKKEFITGS